MGTLVLQDPRSILASYAFSLIDSAINLFTNIVQNHPTTRLMKNLEWLLRVRQRASSRMFAEYLSQPDYTALSADEGDAALIGWRTRLVQRLSKGTQIATNIPPNQSAEASSPNTAMAWTISQALRRHLVPDDGTQMLQRAGPVESSGDQGTDTLVSRSPSVHVWHDSCASYTSFGIR